ncbi:MAG: DUF1027 domain-containing protein [Bacilli bacterium]|nr:DUF1027 domain-containing protein [Bacilli bacterium]
MKRYIFDELEYELMQDYREAFNKEEVQNKMTEYFKDYDYILGDWSYGKLRLKGFCEKNNSLFNNINDIASKDNYLKNNCAYDCRYFILKRINK